VTERAQGLKRALLGWYATEKRDLPWRRTRDPYAIWVSEVMLQQTRVDTVVPYFERFLKNYPTVHALAEAPLERVLGDWSGLGYYRRARMLHAGAQQIVREYEGRLPREAEGLREIAGIGAYTAGAVASIAYGERAPLVDGNVARVLARIFAVEEDVKSSAGQTRLWQLAAELVPEGSAGEWNQALMELGATVCSPRAPRCLLCPVRKACSANGSGRQEELPKIGAKAKPRAWARAALVATRGDKVVLARRKPDLLFGGLWEPPTVDDLGEKTPNWAKMVSLPTILPELAGDLVHVLSHRRMTVTVHHARIGTRAGRPALTAPLHAEYDAVELVARENVPTRGISSLARKILQVGGFRTG
jgi:A/G-specific adenine glycosylase